MMMVEVDSNTAEALLPQITEHYIIVQVCICSQMDGGIQMQKKKKCPEV